ncbi:hypothetical protein Plhal304r1_c018g0065331 [Plasmopara halstedii]
MTNAMLKSERKVVFKLGEFSNSQDLSQTVVPVAHQIERFDEISNISSFSAIPLRYNLQTYKVKGYVAPGVKGTAKNLQKRDYISFS